VICERNGSLLFPFFLDEKKRKKRVDFFHTCGYVKHTTTAFKRELFTKLKRQTSFPEDDEAKKERVYVLFCDEQKTLEQR